MVNRRHMTLGATCVALLTGMVVSGPGARAEDYYHEFARVTQPLCLQPMDGSPAAGTAIVQEHCDGRPAQLWREVPAGNGIVHYRNQASGLCLDARGGPANHTPVQQWPCTWISNENWQVQDVGSDDAPMVYSRVSGTRVYCLDVPGDSSDPGVAAQLYRCNSTGAQLWWTPAA